MIKIWIPFEDSATIIELAEMENTVGGTSLEGKNKSSVLDILNFDTYYDSKCRCHRQLNI